MRSRRLFHPYGSVSLVMTLVGAAVASADAPALVGDLNGDACVDIADWVTLQACFNGPDQPPPRADCAAADLDGDGDIDVADFVKLYQSVE